VVDYVNTFTQLGGELRAARRLEAVQEQFRDSDVGTYAQPQIRAAYNEAVTVEADAENREVNHFLNTVTPALISLHTSTVQSFEQAFQPVLAAELALSLDEQQQGMIAYEYDPVLSSTGQIAILKRRGYLGTLRSQMIADVQTIQQNVPSFGAFTAVAGNLGTLAVAGSPTFAGEDHTLAGTATWTCTDETVDAPKLTLTVELTKPLPDGTTTINADNLVTVGKSYQDGQTGLTFQLDLGSIVKSGDAGSPVFSVESMTKPSEGDTNKGLFYLKVTRQAVAPIWLIEWYNNSDTANPQNLVQRTTADGTVGTIVKSIFRTSVLGFTFSMANANTDMPSAGNTRTVTYDLKTPRVGDKWTRTTINAEAGNFASKIARRYRASLNSGGAPTISDALASSVAMS
jgi:hypothetical protein